MSEDLFTPEFLQALHSFILQAKAATYVGSGDPSESSRPSSHDLRYTQGDFAYLDSYFGSADFIGEEAVYYRGLPVWGENYYGRLLRPDLIRAEEAGQVLKESLFKMYAEGRFLGGWDYQTVRGRYIDQNEGEWTAFTGKEMILQQEIQVYELHYHGGLIR